MAGKDIIMATQEELRRLHIIRKAIDRLITQKEAAGVLELNQRQVCRLVRRVRTEGDIGIIHRSRGRFSNRAIPERIKERALRNDFTIAHENRLYQIKDNIRAEKVVVEEKIDGSMEITHKDSPLKFKEILVRPKREIKKEIKFSPRKIYIPAEDHPWKKFNFNSHYPHYPQKEKVGQKEKELLLTT